MIMYFWTVAIVVFVIWFLSREPYFYDFFVSCKDWVKEFISRQWKSFRSFSALKQTYIIVSGVIGLALFILFLSLYFQIYSILFNPLEEKELDANFALAFLGTITGGVALFTGFIAILRSETNERQSKAAEDQSKASNEQSKAANEQSRAANKQSEAALTQSKAAVKQSEIANRQANIAEDGLIIDRINKATEGLGKNNDAGEPIIEVRLGALYALERIAQDSIRDHVQIMEMLCAYIRTNSPLVSEDSALERPREDVRLTLSIIGRRKTWSDSDTRIKNETEQGYRIDLRHHDLRGAQLSKADLNNAILNDINLNNAVLHNAIMSNATMSNAKLNKAVLSYTNMNATNFNKATIIDAKFDDADLSKAQFRNAIVTDGWFYDTKLKDADFDDANLKSSWFVNADLSGASLRKANLNDTRITNTNLNGTRFDNATTQHTCSYQCDFSNCKNLTQEQLDTMFCGTQVQIPEGLTRPAHWPTEDLAWDKFNNAYREWRYPENPKT